MNNTRMQSACKILALLVNYRESGIVNDDGLVDDLESILGRYGTDCRREELQQLLDGADEAGATQISVERIRERIKEIGED